MGAASMTGGLTAHPLPSAITQGAQLCHMPSTPSSALL